MNGKKLLVADDSLTIQKVIRLALSHEGYDIQTVSDGNDALQQIAVFRPDVVLIDVSLPGKTAFEVKRAMNQQVPASDVKFILMSSAFEFVDEEQHTEVQFHGRLTKPFDPANLRQVLVEVLQSGGAHTGEPSFGATDQAVTIEEPSLTLESPTRPIERSPSKAERPFEMSMDLGSETIAVEDAPASEPAFIHIEEKARSSGNRPEFLPAFDLAPPPVPKASPIRSQLPPLPPGAHQPSQASTLTPPPRPPSMGGFGGPGGFPARPPQTVQQPLPPPPASRSPNPPTPPATPFLPSNSRSLPDFEPLLPEDSYPQPLSAPSDPNRNDFSDIRHLTESTIRMSGLDDFQWSVSETNKLPEEPSTFPEQDFQNPPAFSDHTLPMIGDETLGELNAQEPFIAPPSSFADSGNSTFQIERRAVSRAESEDPANAYHQAPDETETPYPEENFAPAKPHTPPLVAPKMDAPRAADPNVMPISVAQMEALLQKQMEEALQKMAQKILPDVAERILRQEIRKMLQEQS